MSRRSEKKSGSSKNGKSASNQPWEQSIYDTKYETTETRTRSNQRKRKRGDTVFLTMLVIMLVLIIAIPTVALMYIKNEGRNTPVAASTESSTVISSTIESSSSAEVSSTEDSEAQESTDENQEEITDPNATDDGTDTNTDDGTGEYATVQAGDGPYTFASRNGITLDQLYQLNGMNENSMMQPGQSLRIR